jgi:hypothetical protein
MRENKNNPGAPASTSGASDNFHTPNIVSDERIGKPVPLVLPAFIVLGKLAKKIRDDG